MKLFFSDESLIPKILFDGIANEYSHLETGGIERGAIPISVAEFRICAQRILDGIKKNDENQYKYFLALMYQRAKSAFIRGLLPLPVAPLIISVPLNCFINLDIV